MREYKCLETNVFTNGSYKLVPIRDIDKFEILKWRNSQLSILRQKKEISIAEQENYFKANVDLLFNQTFPRQLLWSFLLNEELVGYGGLVHIDWESKNAEISFLTPLHRSQEPATFNEDWKNYLTTLTEISFNYLNFEKIYTYAYSLRENLFPILENFGFRCEATLRKHICIDDFFYDVKIHSKFRGDEELHLEKANPDHSDLLFFWRNEEAVRQASFKQEEISKENHDAWYNSKLNSQSSQIFILYNHNLPLGQIRIDLIGDSSAELSYAIDKTQRGQGYGSLIVKEAIKKIELGYPTIKTLVAKVKVSNYSSYKIFVQLGFSITLENDYFLFNKILK